MKLIGYIFYSYLFILFSLNIAQADIADDTEILLNWAEETYPNYFPSYQTTQTFGPWLFRYYPQSDTYAGVNIDDQGVYVLGGPWGNQPTFISELRRMSRLVARHPPTKPRPTSAPTNEPVSEENPTPQRGRGQPSTQPSSEPTNVVV